MTRYPRKGLGMSTPKTRAAGEKRRRPVPAFDVRIENRGSLVLVRPTSAAGEEWLTENVSHDAQEFGGALVVEPRYLDDLVVGMRADGLVVA